MGLREAARYISPKTLLKRKEVAKVLPENVDVFIDPENGNNATAEINNAHKPFSSLGFVFNSNTHLSAEIVNIYLHTDRNYGTSIYRVEGGIVNGNPVMVWFRRYVYDENASDGRGADGPNAGPIFLPRIRVTGIWKTIGLMGNWTPGNNYQTQNFEFRGAIVYDEIYLDCLEADYIDFIGTSARLVDIHYSELGESDSDNHAVRAYHSSLMWRQNADANINSNKRLYSENSFFSTNLEQDINDDGGLFTYEAGSAEATGPYVNGNLLGSE